VAEIEFRNVCKIFDGNVTALDNLSLTIDDGEFMVLVGPSGCGKSTALRLVAGLEQITDGQILADGKPLNALTPQERNVAVVFQNYALYPHKTVRQNLDFPLKMMKLRKSDRQRRIAETARLLGLEAFLDRRPKKLSGGQQQRVAMGRAIVREPIAFLMDEPLSNLDAKLRVEIRAQIADVQKRIRTTTLYVTHDQVEAMTLGDRVGVLQGGRLQQVARSQELYDCPTNVFVATFIGSPRMNIFPARVGKSAGGQVRLHSDNQQWEVPLNNSRSARLDQHIDTTVFVGLRPEAFAPAGEQQQDPPLEGTVTAIEALGHERIVYVNTTLNILSDGALSRFNHDAVHERDEPGRHKSGEPLIVRMPAGQPMNRGDRIRLRPLWQKIHFFDDKGNALNCS